MAERFYNLLLYGLILTIPFEKVVRAAPNLILISLVILLPFVIKKNQIYRLKTPVMLMFIIFIIFIALSSFIVRIDYEDIKLLKKILLLPLLFLVFLFSNSIKNISLTFIISVFFLMTLSLFSLILFALETKSFDFSNGEAINQILITERLYHGLLCTISFFLSLKLLNNVSSKVKLFLIINLILTTATVFIISARMAIITIVCLGIITIIKKNKIRHTLALMALLTLLLTLSFILNSNLRKRFFYSADDSGLSYVQKIQEWEPRMVIWSCGLSAFKEASNKITGIGGTKTEQMLMSCYDKSIVKKDKREWFLKKKFNMHNQFLDILVSYGMLGLIIFLSLLYAVFIKSEKNFFSILLLIAIILFCLVENILHRQVGVYIFALTIFIISNNSRIFEIEKN